MNKNIIFLIVLIIMTFSGCLDEEEKEVVLKKKVTQNKKTDEIVKIDSINTLKEFILKGQKKGYFPKYTIYRDYYTPMKLKPVTTKYRISIDWNKTRKYNQHNNHIIYALENMDRNIKIYDNDTVIMTGDGNDNIEDTKGDNIFYPGGGNDIVKTSGGSNIIILDKDWGKDKVKLNSYVVNKQKISSSYGSYPWIYSSFVIFGKDIYRKDIFWKENTLVNIKTGDSLELDNRNINVVFSTDEDRNIIIPEIREPKIIDLKKYAPESITEKDGIAYYSMRSKGLHIINVKDINTPKLLSKMILPGEVFSVKIDKGIAYVAQGDYGLVDNIGWLSIIDISNPLKPKILKSWSFASNIYDIEVENNTLYIFESNSRYKGFRNIVTYDISDPSKPKFITSFQIKYHSKYFAVKNSRLYISSVNKGLFIYDLSNKNEIKFLSETKTPSSSIHAIEIKDNRLFLNYSSRTFSFSVYNIDENNDIKQICTPEETKNEFIGQSINGIFIKDNYVFKAIGKGGVSITNIENCKLVNIVPFDDFYVDSVSIIGNTLIAFTEKKESKIYSFKSLKDLIEKEFDKPNDKKLKIAPNNQSQQKIPKIKKDSKSKETSLENKTSSTSVNCTKENFYKNFNNKKKIEKMYISIRYDKNMIGLYLG